MPLARVDDHAGGLVDHGDFGVFVEDVEGDVFGDRPDAWQLGQDHRHAVAGAEAM